MFSGYRCPFPRVKEPVREFDHSTPFSTKVKNEQRRISTPLIWHHSVESHNFVLVIAYRKIILLKLMFNNSRHITLTIEHGDLLKYLQRNIHQPLSLTGRTQFVSQHLTFVRCDLILSFEWQVVPSLQPFRPISPPNFLTSTATDADCIKFLIYEKNSSFDMICRQFLMD